MARRCRQVPFLSAKKVSQRGRGCARNSVSRSSPVNSIQDRTLTRSAGHCLIKAKDALLLNIASTISCHKLVGVALARCSWRSVKNDPPTAERAAHVVVEPIGGLGKPRPWGYSR